MWTTSQTVPSAEKECKGEAGRGTGTQEVRHRWPRRQVPFPASRGCRQPNPKALAHFPQPQWRVTGSIIWLRNHCTGTATTLQGLLTAAPCTGDRDGLSSVGPLFPACHL